MTISVLQAIEIVPDASSSTTVVGNITVSAGSIIEVVTTWGNAALTVLSCTDANGTYTPIDTGQNAGGDQALANFYMPNVAAGATTITVTFSSSINFRGLYIREIGGAKTSSPLDGHHAAQGTSFGGATDGLSSGTDTSTNQPALVCGFLYADNAHVGTAGTGFTGATPGWNTGGGTQAFAESKRVTATGSQAATYTAEAGHGADDYVIFLTVYDEITTSQSASINGTATVTAGLTGTGALNDTIAGSATVSGTLNPNLIVAWYIA